MLLSICLRYYFLNLGLVFSWGDGDFGKLGRGGSEGCNIPQNIERLNGQGVCQIECGAQFSLALTKSGVVWTWYVNFVSVIAEGGMCGELRLCLVPRLGCL